MKRNITINLFGCLFNIDEDAYNLLHDYQENMRSYYSRMPEGEEICDDIEHRIAELLSELKASGTEAISIEHVQDIIHRIGNPDEMDDAEPHTINSNSQDTSGKQQETLSEELTNKLFGRKLYRDKNDKILGGVMSGLAKFCGSNDPTPFRIILILLLFCSFSTVGIIYLILWAVTPEARTTEEQLRMRGEEVSPRSISEEVVRQNSNATQGASSRNSLGRTLMSILAIIFKGILLLGGINTVMIFFVGITIFGSIALGGDFASTFHAGAQDAKFLAALPYNFAWWLTAGCSLGLVWSSIALFGVCRLIMNKSERLSSAIRVSLTAFGLAAFVAMWLTFAYCAGKAFGTAAHFHTYYEEKLEPVMNIYTTSTEPGSTYQLCLSDTTIALPDSLTFYYQNEDDSTSTPIQLQTPFTSHGGQLKYGCIGASEPVDLELHLIE